MYPTGGILQGTLVFPTESSKPPFYVCRRNEVWNDGGQRHDVCTDQKVQDPARHDTDQSGICDRAEVTNRNASQAGV